MKRIILAGLLFLGASGCAHRVKEYALNSEQQATIGSRMMAWEYSPSILLPKTRKELVYSGVDHGVVNIAYREYIDDARGYGFMARPAFGQELKYDITDKKEIAFQDIHIRVISADGEKISFIVLNDPKEVTEESSAKVAAK